MITIEITGLEELKAKFHNMANALPGAQQQILHNTAQRIVEEAQFMAPVRTGFLRDNIDITSESETDAVVSSNADYSSYVEFGSSKAEAQPYFYNSVEMIINQELAEIIHLAMIDVVGQI